MKALLILALFTPALALPSALVLPASEIASRENAWLAANPSGRVAVMTSRADCGAGQSMRPMLEPGDDMVFEAYTCQKLKGCVISLKVPYCALPIAHFCYDETATHVFMSGMNNARSDGWLPKYDKDGKCLVIGVLVGILRKDGK